jgi:uncharacterized protein (TIGR02270 family)
MHMNTVPLSSIIEQHAEESGFLWGLRNRLVQAAHVTLANLVQLDERIEAHLDGLRLAGDYGWELCVRGLDEGGPGEVFAAAVLAFEAADPERARMVTEKGPTTARASGVASALGWLPYRKAETHVAQLVSADSPVLRRVGLAAAFMHRRHPGNHVVNKALSDGDAALRARVIRGAGELGLVGLLPALGRCLAEKEPHCRFWAAWSIALLSGDANALDVLISVAVSQSAHSVLAVQLLMRRVPPHLGRACIDQWSENARLARLTAIAVGALGDPAKIPWLMERMKVTALARVAAEAFTTITGADLSLERLDAPRPEGFESGPTDDPDDEDVSLDPDDDLPWPNVEAIQKWWEKSKGRFAAGTRFLMGKPIAPDSLQQILRGARQRQRAAAALELAIKQTGQPLFDVRAPGFRQVQTLASDA